MQPSCDLLFIFQVNIITGSIFKKRWGYFLKKKGHTYSKIQLWNITLGIRSCIVTFYNRYCLFQVNISTGSMDVQENINFAILS